MTEQQQQQSKAPFRISIYLPNGDMGPRDVVKYYENDIVQTKKGVSSMELRSDADLISFAEGKPGVREVWLFSADAKSYTIFSFVDRNSDRPIAVVSYDQEGKVKKSGFISKFM